MTLRTFDLIAAIRRYGDALVLAQTSKSMEDRKEFVRAETALCSIAMQIYDELPNDDEDETQRMGKVVLLAPRRGEGLLSKESKTAESRRNKRRTPRKT